ncbi:MAG: recombinase family protein [Chloroflexi bacterium]|nr:recombinase family protein [Chloroflexota bacterium]
MRHPVGYLRKSRVTSDRTVSWEVQEDAIRKLAAEHGDGTALELLSDWNKSGRRDGRGRPGYRRLVELIEADEVGALYSYSLSRLSRSLADFAKLVELCRAHGVEIHLAADRHLDFGTASGRGMVNVLASFAQMEAELAQERARDTVAVRRARGDRIGPTFYGERDGEDVSAVTEAFHEAGSVLGTARLLNARGVATRRGGLWSATSVRQILLRFDLLPRRGRQGAKPAAPFLLYHLLRCRCGRLLTGVRYRNGPNPNYVVYRCLQGRSDPAHGDPRSVPETRLLPWVMSEAARLRTPELVEVMEADAQRRAALAAERERVLDMYQAGLINQADRDRRLAGIAERQDALDNSRRVAEVPEVDWTWPAEEINAVLRALWGSIELDEHMRPVRAAWLVPEWRALEDATETTEQSSAAPLALLA